MALSTAPQTASIVEMGNGSRRDLRSWNDEIYGVGVRISDGDGYTLLHIAVDHGHLEIVQLLMTAGASPAARADGRNTPNTLARGQCKEIRAALRKREKKKT